MPRRSSVHGRADAWRAGSATPELCLPAPVHALVPAPLPFEVLEAKIRVPPVRPGTVSRTALVNRLRANTSLPVLTLTAPVGYGKTTLLAQWAARDARPLAWVAVDERDEDPVVLLRHVAAAPLARSPARERARVAHDTR
jgi:hypothetical protein